MRGHRSRGFGAWHPRGTIPAYAGAPHSSAAPGAHVEDYPRVCGGTPSCSINTTATMGLSPRMRGHRVVPIQHVRIQGTIPAYAGAPWIRYPSRRRSGDYPRVCGGTFPLDTANGRVEGLSPRMRGHRVELGIGGKRERTIPAYAGAPRAMHDYSNRGRDYPRVCGGTSDGEAQLLASRGLSPRMRGHHRPLAGHACPGGTIPAYAGAPAPRPGTAGHSGDYPRVCGGTSMPLWQTATKKND